MKKRIIVTIALLMILCLALTGCGQRDTNTTEPGNQTSQTNTEPATTNEDNNTEAQTNPADTHESTNPSDNTGLYTYGLHGGITISCKTNVWDYISGNSFDLRAMAHDLGWTIDFNDMPECNMFSKDFGEDTAVVGGIYAKYDYTGSDLPIVGISRVLPGGVNKELFIYYYSDPTSTYTVNGSGPTFSFDAIPILAYLYENYSLENENPVAEIFADYKVPKEQKTSTWIDYRLP